MASEQDGFLPAATRGDSNWSGVSGWESALSAMRAEVPSIDSDDSSLSDCEEEELHIFQREDTNLIPDLSIELLDDGELNSEVVTRQMSLEKVEFSDSLEPSPNVCVPLSVQKAELDDTINSRNPETEQLCPEPIDNIQTESMVGIKDSEKEDGFRHVLHSSVTTVLKPQINSNVDSEYEIHPGNTEKEHLSTSALSSKPVGLSLQFLECLEQWDLNALLHQLKEEEVQEREMPPLILSMEESTERRHKLIMEKLVEFAAQQSEEVSSVPQLEEKEKEGTISKSSFRPYPDQKMYLKGSGKHPQSFSTICLDLRTTVSKMGQVTSLEQNPENPSQRNEQKEKHHLNKTDHTGKSLLLRNRHNIQNDSLSDANMSNSESLSKEKKELGTPTQRKQRPKSKVDISPKLQEMVGREEKDGREEQEKEKEILQYLPPKSLINSRADEFAQREKQEKEKKARLRMLTQLEDLKPRSSVNGRQPMAEATPILFHPETSYCPGISSLPDVARSGVETLLLTICLSSCGQVFIPGQHGARSSYPSLFLANTFHCLLTWLISLVPGVNTHGKVNAPFHVLGLQQAWQEEGLALYACLSPRQIATQSSPKIRKHKGKQDLRGTSSFYQRVSLFLSHNTLQSVIWWSEDVVERLQGKLFPLPTEVPAVRLSSIATLNSAPEAVEKVFSSACGFYWQTLETEEKINPLLSEIPTDSETEVVSVIVFERMLSNPTAFHHTLHIIQTEGLDVCGVRLLYPQANALHSYIDTVPSSYTGGDGQTLPVLALALRGTQAEHIWAEIAGPFDPQLARLTDQYSLNAMYGFKRGEPIMHWARKSGRLLQELSLWFGGRIPPSGSFNIGFQNPYSRSTQPRSANLRSRSDSEKDVTAFHDTDRCRPPALLTASILGDVFLVVSPAVPSAAYGDVIDICLHRGFALYGLRRLRLSAKRSAMLSMSSTQVSIFCPNVPHSQTDAQPCRQPRLHCFLLLLRKENAAHHTSGLIQALMNELAERGLLGAIHAKFSYICEVDPSFCFHVAPYTDNLLQSLGGSLHAMPDLSTVPMDMLSLRPFASDPEDEQVVVLTMSGKHTLRRAGYFLQKILRPTLKTPASNTGSVHDGFELLGLKWLPSLSRLQAKEITPYEVGDRPWQRSIEHLISNPALLCALRRSNAFAVLQHTIKQLAPTLGMEHPQLIASATPEIAFRQAALIFSDRDLVSDPESRSSLMYIPPTGINCRAGGTEDRRGTTESIFTYMLSGPPVLYTVLLLKPRIWSSALGKILYKVHQQKFILVGMKPVSLTTAMCSQILPEDVKKSEALCLTHCDYLTSGPCLALCLQRRGAVLKLLDVLGPEDPELCRAQDQFLWRAQYGTSAVQNGMYGSTSYQAAIRDIKTFFPEGLLFEESTVLQAEQIPKLTSDILVCSRSHRQTVKNPACGPELPTTDLPFTSALCQTTCLLFPPHMLRTSPPPYIPALEQLMAKEFHITAARLTAFDQLQAQLVAEMYSPGNYLTAKIKLLTEGPCLLVAAQRDNAVTCFPSLVHSDDRHNMSAQTLTEQVLCPQTESQANKMLSCFFDSLTPDSIHQILH
ncbi:dynein axonemal-associated protein 1 [Xenopus laevis]|uniref:Dynein axonemal assembly factor 8 n=2 Tax=Xenopus laevis TaxID=8355 RepID=DAAF8_XENLA|nr:dynein axonemal-associated protein 1 [Xenopus laevis]A0A1L8EYB2.1 RecName: Full=Dynein axonemal assembly factor 8; AltName: Full=Dynein axonemal-associated protein 1 [Xenopus laevis]OCT64336.1 hypothetical protein XELAEV_18045439mg [Xenopus laevis]